MDPEELSKKYMKQYNQLTDDFKNKKIDCLLDELNNSIAVSDMQKTNTIYSELMNWDMRVANLDGVRNALNGQFPYLHLPSPVSYSIIFDAEQKVWKYNTEKS